ncbi:MAG: chorismate-binding protein [Sphingobacteriaceae bacterium]|nr:chorismate-binding protein [Sphingobacteriaceae bacterium]
MLKENADFDTIIEATFPMASMTGAPKISAMNFIEHFEKFARRYYSGAMGLIEENGDF